MALKILSNGLFVNCISFSRVSLKKVLLEINFGFMRINIATLECLILFGVLEYIL